MIAPENIEDPTSTTDGLYADPEEANRYVYRGSSVNNYICLGGSGDTCTDANLYRIVAIEPNNGLKVVKNETLGSMYWNTTSSTTWANASLNSYLNSTYYNSLNQNTVRQYIDTNPTYYVGNVSYSGTLQNTIDEEHGTAYVNNVGLLNVSDFLRSMSLTYSNISCGSFDTMTYTPNLLMCGSGSWLKTTLDRNDTDVWFINPGQSTNVSTLDTHYSVQSYRTPHEHEISVHPVFYLKSNILLKGQGTEQTPYRIDGTRGSAVPIGDGGYTPSGSNTIVYAWHDDAKTIGTSTITDGVSNYTQLSSYQNGVTQFMKYEINSSNVIQKAWVCETFGVLSTPVCLQGGNSSYLSDNLSTLTALSTNSQFTSAGGVCTSATAYTMCYIGNKNIEASTSNSDYVEVFDDDGYLCAIGTAAGCDYV